MIRFYSGQSTADGSPCYVEAPGRLTILGARIDPGTSDTLVNFGGSRFTVKSADGPGRLPLDAPVRVVGTISIQNATGDATILVLADDGEDECPTR